MTLKPVAAISRAEPVTAALLVIGDEILSGRTKDRNIGIVADALAAIGIGLREARVVPDNEAAIVAAVDALRRHYTYVFTTGGIGPTHDDVTAESVAKAFGVTLALDERAIAMMRPYYDARGVALSGARLRMARIPAGADLIANPVSAAPGFIIENVIVLPGIPETMSAMLAETASRLAGGERARSVTLRVDRAEGDVASLFASHQEEYPTVTMGSYPFMEEGRFGTELVLRATDERMLSKAAAGLKQKLIDCGCCIILLTEH